MSDIKIDRVTVHFGGKGSVGGYQNAERSVTVEAALPDGWTFDQAQQALFDLARVAVARQWREVVRGQVDRGYAVQLASAGEARVRDYLEMRAAFDYFEAIDADMAETWLTETTAEILRVAAQVEASRAEEAAKVLPLDGEPEEDDEEGDVLDTSNVCSSCGQSKDGEWCANEDCEAYIPF